MDQYFLEFVGETPLAILWAFCFALKGTISFEVIENAVGASGYFFQFV
jgi:hypothetical protein